jgi:homoserine dehydrogenase
VTANKRAISASLELYNSVYSAVRTNNRMYMSEVTIGAALPIQTTLNDLLCSGDAVHSIVGLMSVSAGVILSAICEDGLSFSDAVEKTHITGLFEDDVFVDLEGTEAAQKLLILGRELGCAMSIEDIEVEPLATRRQVVSWHDLKDVFAKENVEMARRAKEANAKGCTLRYVQRIECSTPAGFGSGSPVQVCVI